MSTKKTEQIRHNCESSLSNFLAKCENRFLKEIQKQSSSNFINFVSTIQWQASYLKIAIRRKNDGIIIIRCSIIYVYKFISLNIITEYKKTSRKKLQKAQARETNDGGFVDLICGTNELRADFFMVYI
jgi:hypothetical protein